MPTQGTRLIQERSWPQFSKRKPFQGWDITSEVPLAQGAGPVRSSTLGMKKETNWKTQPWHIKESSAAWDTGRWLVAEIAQCWRFRGCLQKASFLALDSNHFPVGLG
jgi:hypothetical protein